MTSQAANLSALGQTSQAAARIREIVGSAKSSAAENGTSTFWQPTYEMKARYVTKDVYETREVFEDRAITEQRNVYGERDLYEERAAYGARDTYATRDVFETRDLYEALDIVEAREVFEEREVYETRNIHETRPIYEKQAVLETHVYGTRDIDNYAKTRAAGIDVGADFAMQVEDGDTAEVKFVGNKKISVTVSGDTREFAFDGKAGSFSAGLVQALNSIADVSADYTKDGKLHLKTSQGQSLTISEVTNGRRDRSESPLDQLGLAAGATKASVVGYREVQIGTEQVIVGAERVKVGIEKVKVGTLDVKVGTQQVKVGIETVKTGVERYLSGTEVVQVGTERVKTGSEKYVVGSELVTVGTEKVKVGQEQVVVGSESVKVGTERVISGYERTLVGFTQPRREKKDAHDGDVQFNTVTQTSARLVGLLFGKVSAPSISLGAARSAYAFFGD